MNILFLYWIYKEYEYISLWLCLPGNCFKWKIYKSREKEIVGNFFEKKQISGIHELFANTSHLKKIIPIPIRTFWHSRTIPIPICTEVGSANLLLFLFAGKITIHWSLAQLECQSGWVAEWLIGRVADWQSGMLLLGNKNDKNNWSCNSHGCPLLAHVLTEATSERKGKDNGRTLIF